MARIDIPLPERFLFTTEIPVRIGDVNYGGHLGNDAVLSLAHEARVRFLAAHGWTELALAGVGILMVDAAIVYRAEGRWGMVLRVELGAGEVRTRDCELVYRLTDASSGAEVARVRTGIVFIDPSSRRLVRMPEALRAVLGVPPRAA